MVPNAFEPKLRELALFLFVVVNLYENEYSFFFEQTKCAEAVNELSADASFCDFRKTPNKVS